jgi:hypothetical protein
MTEGTSPDTSDLIDWLLADISLTSVNDLNDDTLGLVLWEAREYKPALALVCRRWAAAVAKARMSQAEVLIVLKVARRGHLSLLEWIPTVWPYLFVDWEAAYIAGVSEGHWRVGSAALSRGLNCCGPDALASGAVKTGDAAMVELVISWARSLYYSGVANTVLRVGAECGNLAMCRLARKQGADDYLGMLVAAVRKGHDELCMRALDWMREALGAWVLSAPRVASAAVSHDIRHGGARMCTLLNSRGISRPSDLMFSAAAAGSERLCLLAREWGAKKYAGMLYEAAKAGNERLCSLALQWGAPSHDDMFLGAIEEGHAALAEQAEKGLLPGTWSGEDCEFLLRENIITSPAIAKLLLRRGASPRVLLSVAVYRSVDLCKLALAHGANPRELAVPSWAGRFLSALDSPEDLLELGLELLGPEPDYMDIEFFDEDAYAICHQALPLGKQFANWLLCRSASAGSVPLCRIALDHGARDFNGMLMSAYVGREDYMFDLARQWGATATPQHDAAYLHRVSSE